MRKNIAECQPTCDWATHSKVLLKECEQ